MAVRWRKEWVPLLSQQMRIRNLTQVLAYNLVSDCTERPVFFYTLHLTSKSAPFYTSDQATGLNPRWMEIDFKEKSGLSSSCFVICIWQAGVPDKLVTTWGVCLSGLQLAPLDQDLSRTVTPNNLVFVLQGLRFVPPVQDQSIERLPSALVNSNDTKISYPVNQLRRLKTYQFKLAEETVICESLRQEILRVGSFSPSGSLEFSSGDKFHAQQLHKSCENLRHKIKLLREEKARKEISINVLKSTSEKLAQETENRSAQLQKLKRHLEENISLADSRVVLSETRDAVTQTWSQLVQRRQELISQLKYIYPIAIDPQGLAKICGVPLISSEELNSQDEASSSVALGFAAHATMMVAFFLDVPLRYPTRPEGSRAKIWDMVAAKLPDTEREFPLFSRGRDAIQFYYAVYLLNKNIAQLKYYTGFGTRDLRTTLHNLRELLYMKPIIPHMKTSFSASSLEAGTAVGSQNAPSVSSAEDDRLMSKARIPAEEVFKGSSDSVDVGHLEPPRVSVIANPIKESVLSHSLDEGLNVMNEQAATIQSSLKTSNNSEPSLNSNEDAAPPPAKEEPVPELVPLNGKAKSPDLENIKASGVKLRTQSECEPQLNNSKENLPSFNSLDNLFANVASRTEALASKSGSFNLVRRPVEKS